MSNETPRPVSFFSVAFVFIGFALFFVFVWKVYLPRRGAPALAVAAEQLPKQLEWKATPGTRRGTLKATRDNEEKLETQYSWADKDKGVVRIPIDRAMEMTLKDINAAKGTR